MEQVSRRKDDGSAISQSDSSKLVDDFTAALGLLNGNASKDARPGKIQPDEAVTENLIVNHDQRATDEMRAHNFSLNNHQENRTPTKHHYEAASGSMPPRTKVMLKSNSGSVAGLEQLGRSDIMSDTSKERNQQFLTAARSHQGLPIASMGAGIVAPSEENPVFNSLSLQTYIATERSKRSGSANVIDKDKRDSNSLIGKLKTHHDYHQISH